MLGNLAAQRTACSRLSTSTTKPNNQSRAALDADPRHPQSAPLHVCTALPLRSPTSPEHHEPLTAQHQRLTCYNPHHSTTCRQRAPSSPITQSSPSTRRQLNSSRGPAVRGLRAQMDRSLYKQHLQQALAAVQGLVVHDGAVTDLLLEQQQGGRPRVAGVKLASGESIRCRAVVVTTGTFLRGVIHIGSKARPAGRMPSSVATGRREGDQQLRPLHCWSCHMLVA